MNPVIKHLLKGVSKDISYVSVAKTTASFLAQKATFTITVDQRVNGYLFSRLLPLLARNSVFELTNARRINATPKTRDDVSVLGLGKIFAKLGGCYVHVMLGERTDVISAMSSQVIIIKGLVVDRTKIENFLKDLGYPAEMFLPYVIDPNGDVIGLVEKRYGTQRQFVTDDIYNEIDATIDRMVNNRQWYIDNEMPHKATFLLYGPPGTGKSTIARHFSSKYDLNIKSLTPETLRNDYSDMLADKPHIVLLEDIDAFEYLLKPEHRKALVTTSNSKEAANYSAFINILDGVVPLKNVIVIMTTNFREKLLESIYRDGRVDKCMYMGRYTAGEIIKYAGWESKESRSNYIRKQDMNIINVAVLKKITMTKDIDELKAVMAPVIKAAELKALEEASNSESEAA